MLQRCPGLQILVSRCKKTCLVQTTTSPTTPLWFWIFLFFFQWKWKSQCKMIICINGESNPNRIAFKLIAVFFFITILCSPTKYPIVIYLPPCQLTCLWVNRCWLDIFILDWTVQTVKVHCWTQRLFWVGLSPYAYLLFATLYKWDQITALEMWKFLKCCRLHSMFSKERKKKSLSY